MLTTAHFGQQSSDKTRIQVQMSRSQPSMTLEAPPGGGLLLGARSLFCLRTEGGVGALALRRLLGRGVCPGAGAVGGPGKSWAALSCSQGVSPARMMLLACWHLDMLRGAFRLTRLSQACTNGQTFRARQCAVSS